MNRVEALQKLTAPPLKLTGEERLMHSKKVLVIAPHHDDETLGCGGMLLKLHQKKIRADIAVATKSKKRELELYRAMEVLNVTGIYLLPFCDRSLILQQNTALLEREFRKILKEQDYGMIFIPYVFDTNADHRAVVKAFGASLNPDIAMGVCMYEIWTPILYPNFYIDITGEYIEKERAILCYQSQLIKYPLLERDKKLREFRAGLLNREGCGQAEAFKLFTAARFQEIMGALYEERT